MNKRITKGFVKDTKSFGNVHTNSHKLFSTIENTFAESYDKYIE